MFQTDTDDDTDSDDDDFIATSDNNEAANNDHNDTDSLSGEILNIHPKEHFSKFQFQTPRNQTLHHNLPPTPAQILTQIRWKFNNN